LEKQQELAVHQSWHSSGVVRQARCRGARLEFGRRVERIERDGESWRRDYRRPDLRMGATEVWRDLVKLAAVRDKQRYLPALHVVSAPSPVATFSFAIGQPVAQRAAKLFGL
jgi:hypothetical protein